MTIRVLAAYYWLRRYIALSQTQYYSAMEWSNKLQLIKELNARAAR